MRKIYLPLDIFRVIDRRVREKLGKDIEFYEVRKKASAYFTEKEATLAELYLKFAEIADIDLQTASLIQAIELEVEEAFIVPRTDIVDLLKMAVGRHKKIYLMSDMYLPKEFLQRIIEKYLGMHLSGCDIWISAELGVKKKDGTMWEKLVLHEAPMNILHIGDNLHSDIEMAQKYGIHTYYVMSGADMLSHSSIRGMAPYICTIEESLMMGLIMARWFNSPFALNVSKGRICVAEFDDMGYGLFGSLMLSFLRWLTQNSQVKAYDDFVFMSRDGYFLQQDYEFYKTISGQNRLPKSKYLKISRRLLAIANIKDRESFEYALRLPYNGSFGEYMEDRFSIAVGQDRNQDIHVSLPGDALKIVDWLKPYESQIKGEIQAEAKNYLKYLESMMVSKNFAVVDLCYYGTTQYLLAKFMKQQIDGYYFFANIMDTNQYYQNNMFPCFQTSDDPSAAQSETHKHVLLLESFLTAPYGMVMKVDENGQVIYNRDMENQIHFQEREQINIGIKQYLKDFVLLNGTQEVLGSSFITFSDRLYGMMMEDGIAWNTKIKTAFYNDNAMIHRRQLQILE
ncbi:MAG: HAD hydrolase-like protein [Hungatella sp.]